jgi:hypothetical protein
MTPRFPVHPVDNLSPDEKCRIYYSRVVDLAVFQGLVIPDPTVRSATLPFRNTTSRARIWTPNCVPRSATLKNSTRNSWFCEGASRTKSSWERSKNSTSQETRKNYEISSLSAHRIVSGRLERPSPSRIRGTWMEPAGWSASEPTSQISRREEF